jgi:hypothetical protein
VKSFRLVQGAEAIDAPVAGSGEGKHVQLDPLRQIRLVTLIYQGLDLTARKMARDASLDLLKSDLPQNVYMAVMVIDHQLEAIQQFTNDRELLKKAVLRATGGDNQNFVGDTDRVEAELQQILGQYAPGFGERHFKWRGYEWRCCHECTSGSPNCTDDAADVEGPARHGND